MQSYTEYNIICVIDRWQIHIIYCLGMANKQLEITGQGIKYHDMVIKYKYFVKLYRALIQPWEIMI